MKMTMATKSVDEAFRAFDRWRADHDPSGNLEILEAAIAYSKWAQTNSIKPYLDDNARTTSEK